MMEVRDEVQEYSFSFVAFLWITCMRDYKAMEVSVILEYSIQLQTAFMILNITLKVCLCPPFLFRNSVFNPFPTISAFDKIQNFESFIIY